MKKKIVICLLSLVTYISANAQVDPHAIGLRIGGGDNFGAEVSYQHGLSRKNRLELDFGAGGNDNYSRIGISGMYHWVWNIGNEGLNWYIGPGAGLSFNNGKSKHEGDDYVGLAIGGQVGLGFNFKIPLQLTLDTRPMFDFLADDDAFGWGIALGVRYRF